jgi:hypothetical protein
MFEIEAMIRRVERLDDEPARERARDLVAGVLELHAQALGPLVEELRRLGGDDAVRTLATNEAVGCVLALHGLHEEPLQDRAAAREPRATPGAFVPLERLRARRPANDTHDRCDLCGAPVAEAHDHLVDPERRDLRCACQACGLLFRSPGGRWLRVPRRVERIEPFDLDDGAWSALGIPVDLAFFVRSSKGDGVVAMYPGPAGATEARVHPDAWSALASRNPPLGALAPDVEACLVRRERGSGAGGTSAYRVSIDACYALVGRIRSHWRGLGGGGAVWTHVDAFFEALRTEAGPSATIRARREDGDRCPI